jgi:methionyl-tRNA synthetase
LLNAVMPRACAKLWASLGAEPALGPLADQRIDSVARWGQLPAEARVTRGEVLFPRLEEPAS